MKDRYIVLRTPSGISGDMLLTGMARMANVSGEDLNQRVEALGIVALRNCLRLEQTAVDNISGWKAVITLPRERAHRSFADIRKLIDASTMTACAKNIASATFSALAYVEGEIHGKPANAVTFHEVGALDSILDICMVASLFDEISPAQLFCSPLPVCDGVIHCAHGMINAPAPAVMHMLEGVPVYGIDSTGETVTPTAIALLKTLGTRFELWPAMRVEKTARVYGSRILPNVPNGAIFASGVALGPDSRSAMDETRPSQEYE